MHAAAAGRGGGLTKKKSEVRFAAVEVREAGPLPLRSPAVLCTRWTDADYRAERCSAEGEYEARYGRWGVEKIWRDDVLPCRVYLRRCVLAARGLGAEELASFLDGTYLADRETTIREHLAGDPTIMEEDPPAALVGRYSG